MQCQRATRSLARAARVFSMVKRKFGASVRAQTLPAQVNKTLLECLCRNLGVLVHAIHELKIDLSFWSRAWRPRSRATPRSRL